MEGKGIFIWHTASTKGGDAHETAHFLLDAGFERVDVKAANGAYRYMPGGVDNLTPEYVAGLQAEGLKVYGWQFIYGQDPAGEARIANAEIARLGLDGWIFDWEALADAKKNATSRASTLVRTVRAANPTLPLGWCSWALFENPHTGAQWHPRKIAETAMAVCDFAMPMMYWVPVGNVTPYPANGIDNALFWLVESLKQWRAITNKPIIPVGRAYDGDGTTAEPDAVRAFGEETSALGLQGISWWVLERAQAMPDIWPVLVDLPGFSATEPIEPPAIGGLDEVWQAIRDLEHWCDAINDEVTEIENALRKPILED
ncbi:MAG: hypothetical protein DRJ03_01485 [Chloroflexi bacterium]|nr:MAG: hypothetical protein DRJ03_01485 [Chloroflexota bacterium]